MDISEFIIICAAIAAILVVYLSGHSWGYSKAKKALENDIQRKRFELIYSPLSSLFLDLHLISCSSTLSPYFQQRIRRSWSLLKNLQFNKAFIALFDNRKTKEKAEIEFGGGFPLDQINKIVKENNRYADDELKGLVHMAGYSQYDANKSQWNNLTDEEYDLFNHIITTDSKLRQLFVPDKRST